MSFHFVVILLTGFPPHPPQGWISLWFSYFGSGYSSNFKPPTWTWSPISWNSLFLDVWNTCLADWRMSCFQGEEWLEWERMLQDLASDLAVIFEKSSPQLSVLQSGKWLIPSEYDYWINYYSCWSVLHVLNTVLYIYLLPVYLEYPDAQ